MAQERDDLFRLPDDRAAKVRELVRTKTKFQHEIAADVGINQGRISEFLTGKRDYLMVRKMPAW